MENSMQLIEYKQVLSEFCFYLSQLARLQTETSVENKLNTDSLFHITERVRILKDKLLACKEKLGFSGGLSFLEDNRFDGFEVKGGVLLGETDKVDCITEPWFYGFEKTGNCYLYEVAVYLQCLAHLDEFDISRKERVRKVSFLTLVKRRCHAWISRIIKSSALEQAEQEAIF